MTPPRTIPHTTARLALAAGVLVPSCLIVALPAAADELPVPVLPAIETSVPRLAETAAPADEPAGLRLAAAAQPAATSGPAQAEKRKKGKKSKLTAFGSYRLRQEVWDWFGNEHGKDRYTFTGSLLRFGAAFTSPHNDLTLEFSQPTLLNLPKDASLGAPLGQLGLGGAYRDANLSQEASLFIKQAFWKFKGIGEKENSARVGRFEFVDGTETTPKDASLAWLKRERIAHRLIGNFGFSDVQRSFDGGQFVHDDPNLNITAFAGMPTWGVFDLDGGATIDQVKVGYASATHPLKGKQFTGEERVFGIYYSDERDQVVKTDNRPLPVRKGDLNPIRITTLGGHVLGVKEFRPGKVDGLLWGAGQFGKWGQESQGSFAFSAEAGFQPKHTWGDPWFRVGYSHFSGDDNPNNNSHGTFFPILPTPRIYARFPFFTEANLDDAFLQAILRPHPKVVVRGDIHFLSLASPNDLWYSGGGAFQSNPSFGYSGRPSNGKDDLGVLYDISVDYQVRKYTTISAYFGYADGGDVIQKIYKSSPHGFLAYLELSQKW